MLKPLPITVCAWGMLLAAPIVVADDAVLLTDLSAAEKKIHAALEKPARLDYVDTPLSDVIEGLKDDYDITVLLDDRALEDVGVDSSEPVTVDLQGISLRSALRLMLRNLELTHVIKDEVLLITTIDEAHAQLTVRIYPVGDLIDRRFTDDGETVVYDFKNLIDVVRVTVYPDSWDKSGGPGSMEALRNNGLLIVSQTEEVHEELADLLAKIRAVKNTNDTPSTVTKPDPAKVVTRSYWLTVPHGEGEATQAEIRPSIDNMMVSSTGADGEYSYAFYFADRIVVRHRRDVQVKLQKLLLSELDICSLKPPGQGGVTGLQGGGGGLFGGFGGGGIGGGGFGGGGFGGGGFGGSGGLGGGGGGSDRNRR